MIKNKLGFTLVELLATVTIMGILMAVAIASYSQYKHKTSNNAYDILSENVGIAAEEYFLEHVTDAQVGSSVSIRDLYCNDYLEAPIDPFSNNSVCYGSATISRITGTKIKKYYFGVHVVCSNKSSCIEYPDKGETSSCPSDSAESNEGVNGNKYTCPDDPVDPGSSESQYVFGSFNIGDSVTSGTSDYTSLNSDVFMEYGVNNNVVTSQKICFLSNNTKYCLKHGDDHNSLLTSVIAPPTGTTSKSYSNGDIEVIVESNGDIQIYDWVHMSTCEMTATTSKCDMD